MKTLSIKQPWAWLICAGYKDIENRRWPIGRNSRHGPYSSRDVDNFALPLPSRIYVHAGKTDDWSAKTEGFLYRIFDADVPLLVPRCGTSPDQFGAIIGEVDITGCVKNSKSPWAVPGQYHFVLANPKLYDKPIPYRGQLGFFNVELTEKQGLERVK